MISTRIRHESVLKRIWMCQMISIVNFCDKITIHFAQFSHTSTISQRCVLLFMAFRYVNQFAYWKASFLIQKAFWIKWIFFLFICIEIQLDVLNVISYSFSYTRNDFILIESNKLFLLIVGYTTKRYINTILFCCCYYFI